MITFRKTISKYSYVLKVSNLVFLLSFLYSIILGLYFQNFYLGNINGEYPSRIISQWISLIFIFYILPLNIVFYFFKKR